MKTSRVYSRFSKFCQLFCFLLSAQALHAQTFNGQPALLDSPTQLQAVIYPVNNEPSTIRVNVNNPKGGSVRVVIRDEKGKVYYDEFESDGRFRRAFDLSSVPAGIYTVELSKNRERLLRTFMIEPPVASHITLIDKSDQQIPVSSVSKKLIVDN
ncbi:T9SS type A sorting domain-containing protein [Spirosoma aerolatum]|uniref:T9SS type A sorting domain-containing protein n=1 Tax=Spirosoma aerolatum TaxID=1211326 RepID=UPI0009ABF823|nr:T9SS type A sorting domain-containing protein [Spirosoma aerolatum]